jgi:acyl-coenzyme A synthetase/AMP-(fatty) acid ligase
VVHVHGGYASGIMETMKVAFDARPGDVIFVVADPGWITGQSYMMAAALLSRVTTVLAEGSPVFPHAGRFAAMIENHGVTIFKAGVTFLKAVMSDPQNLTDIQAYDLSKLRVATFCAEPCSPPVQAFGMAHITSTAIGRPSMAASPGRIFMAMGISRWRRMPALSPCRGLSAMCGWKTKPAMRRPPCCCSAKAAVG